MQRYCMRVSVQLWHSAFKRLTLDWSSRAVRQRHIPILDMHVACVCWPSAWSSARVHACCFLALLYLSVGYKATQHWPRSASGLPPRYKG